MIGKWHLGYYRSELQPLQRGFDSFYGFFSGAEYYFSHAARCEYPDWQCQGPTSCWGLDFWDQNEPVHSNRYSTDLLTERAVQIIKNHAPMQDSPMFMYLPYQVCIYVCEGTEPMLSLASRPTTTGCSWSSGSSA